jgi:hypothetical protein
MYGKGFPTDADVKQAVKSWLQSQIPISSTPAYKPWSQNWANALKSTTTI